MRIIWKFFAVIFLLVLAQPLFGHSVTLTYTDADSTASGIAYNVYRAPGACSSASVFAKLTATPISALTFVDSTVTLGSSYCYQVTAVLSGNESAPSNQVTATVNLPAPPTLAQPQTN